MNVVHSSTPQRNKQNNGFISNLPSPVQAHNNELERSIRQSVINHNRLTQGYVQSPILNDNQIREHFQICLKMYAENRISQKNVWNLKLIDYMRNVLILKTKSTNTEFQIAGTSLDVGTKIYGIRVDDIHSDGLRLANNMARNNEEEIGPTDDNNNSNVANQGNKQQKKKTVKQHAMIAANPETLLENTNKVQSIFFQLQGDCEINLTSVLITSTLPMHYNGHKFMLLSTEKAWQNGKNQTKSTQRYPFEINSVESFVICQPFLEFEIDNWDLNNENNQLNQTDEDLINTETAPIYELDHTLLNDFENGVEEEIDEGHKLEFITNFSPKINKLANDYSFNGIRLYNNKVMSRLWAGPSHWKLKYIQPNNTKFVGHDKKRLETKPICTVPNFINFELDGPVVDKTKLYKAKVRKTEFDPVKCTLPQKIHVENKNRPLMLKPLYHHKTHDSILINSFSGSNSLINESIQVANSEPEDNIMDCSYHEEVNVCQQQQENNIQCLVELPEMVVSTYKPLHAMKSKHMNMKKLKEATWKTILDEIKNDSEEISENHTQTTTFSNVYQKLPKNLTKKMKNKLSCPLAFIALLHTANEKNLLFTKKGDNDFLITQQMEFMDVGT